MEDERMGNNGAYVAGRVISGFRYSHEMHGERFFGADILVRRASGAADIIPLMVSEKLVDVGKDLSGCLMEAIGQFRSYDGQKDGECRLELFLFVQGIRFLDEGCMDGGDRNGICLKGFLCKAPIYRKTPLGREITDILLAVNRPYGRSDYIPCICWGRDAKLASRLDVGCAVRIMGRIQSREYTKRISETEAETRMAYEVSVSSLETEGA